MRNSAWRSAVSDDSRYRFIKQMKTADGTVDQSCIGSGASVARLSADKGSAAVISDAVEFLK